MGSIADKERALEFLQRAAGCRTAQFRPGQWECIRALLERRRLLVVQRTGWGKSMVYFVATKLLRDQGLGLTLLISPLLALMRNQITAADRLKLRAHTINSSNREDWESIKSLLQRDQVDVLLISPERLANDDFRTNVLQHIARRVGLFVVDEVHCISDWGHDFRPDYRRIVRVLQALPAGVPVLGTTATANNRVIADVAAQLGNLQVQRGPLLRESLKLQNIQMPGSAERLAWLAQTLPQLKGSGIIYTLTVRDAERVAQWLKLNGIMAEAYHSDLNSFGGVSRREILEEMLLFNMIKALVSTVALGMGFDKPDLGFVIHFQRPGSIVHYYQQVGRAGRAVDEAYGILLCGEEDEEITDYFIKTALPPGIHVSSVLEALQAAENGLTLTQLESTVNLRRSQILKVLRQLSVENPSPVVKQDSKWYSTPVAYKVDYARVNSLAALRRAEQREMQKYMLTKECLMRHLAQRLDDPYAQACGRCANCRGTPLLPVEVKADLVNAAAIFLRQSHLQILPRKLWPAGTAFPIYGFTGRIPEELQPAEGRILATWGEAGWGDLVRRGKYQEGCFAEELLQGCREMLGQWSPEPAPSWITCVPSLTHPALLPDFCRRLAISLKVPFRPCVLKVRQNRPQKEMENSYRQAGNLDGAFEVDRRIVRPDPVLLVDDLCDSRWTITVIAALLRQAGCSKVYPLALATALPRQS